MVAVVQVWALTACGGGRTDESVPLATTEAVSLGVVELELSGAGGDKLGSTLRWDSTTTQGAPRLRQLASKSMVAAPSSVVSGLDIQLLSAGSVDVGSRTSGGTRYLSATYRVRNAQACASAGSCTPYDVARKNLTFLAVTASNTLNQSAVSRFIKFDGSAANAALVTQLIPTHGMDGLGTSVDASRASLQVYAPSELPPVDPSATGVLPYGFVVRNTTDGSRTLAASPAVGQFDGQVTFAFKIPLQADATNDPFKIALKFQIVEDSQTRVTQSAQEQNWAGDVAVAARAAADSASDIAVLGGRMAQVNKGNPICKVRIAGTVETPTAWLSNNGAASPQVAAAPYNLNNLPLDAGVTLGYCDDMQAPSESTLRVYGSQSGLRKLGAVYGGSLTGGSGTGAPNQLGLNMTGQKPFFPGETVSFVTTAGNRSAAGVAAMPFVGSFRVKGSAVGSSGTFGAPSMFDSGNLQNSQFMASGDVNGDGRLDLVIVNSSLPARVVVYLRNAADGFDAGLETAEPYGANSIVLADVNADGKLDALVTNPVSQSVSVMIGAGNGYFSLIGNVAVGKQAFGLTAGDVNGDGHIDIVTANWADDTVSVLRGDGVGGFVLHQTIEASGINDPRTVILADLNGDGWLDLVANGTTAQKGVAVMLNNGAGGFPNVVFPAMPSGIDVRTVAVGDLNGDGKLDLVIGNDNNSLLVSMGNGAGGFATAVSYPFGGENRVVELLDVNDDGWLDILSGNSFKTAVVVRINDRMGGFSAVNAYTSEGRPLSFTIGDFDGDGRVDVVVGTLDDNTGKYRIGLMLGN